jgi:hypothetical protein
MVCAFLRKGDETRRGRQLLDADDRRLAKPVCNSKIGLAPYGMKCTASAGILTLT